MSQLRSATRVTLEYVTKLSSHLGQIVKNEKTPAPWPRMILCAVACVAPLFIGYLRGQLSLCIYGALTGYLLALNDHLGIIKHRIWVISFTFFVLNLGFVTGFVLQAHPILFEIIIATLVYWLGILGGDGDELERGVLFSVIAMIIVFFSSSIESSSLLPIFLYCLLSFLCILLGIPILDFIHQRQPDAFLRLRQSFQKSLGFNFQKHIHAATYTIATLVAIWIPNYFKIERGYWISITVLLVMRADRTQSIYKTLQRFIGTGAAVICCDLILPFDLHPLFIIAGIGLAAFLVPIGLKKNYLFASFFVTILVLLLLELAAFKHGDTLNAFFRLRATLIGCSISLMGTLLSKLIASTHNFLKGH